MELNANWVAAAASAASVVIIAVTAVAAFVQTSHVRNANEIAVFLRLTERLDSLESEAAFARVGELAARVATDAGFRARMAGRETVEEFRNVSTLLEFLEHLSTLVVTKRLTEDLVFAEYATDIARFWDELAEIVYLRRVARGPYAGATFEHIAMRAKRYISAGKMERFYGRLAKDPRMSRFCSSDTDVTV